MSDWRDITCPSCGEKTVRLQHQQVYCSSCGSTGASMPPPGLNETAGAWLVRAHAAWKRKIEAQGRPSYARSED